MENLKIGSRLACDTCGKVENSKLEVTVHPTEPTKHICEGCRQEIYLKNISAVARKKNNNRMV